MLDPQEIMAGHIVMTLDASKLKKLTETELKQSLLRAYQKVQTQSG